jgi:hypothetical protein
MKHETAGDPMSGLKWTRKTTEKIAEQLAKLKIDVSPNTVGRLLKDKGFSLRVNHKKLTSGNRSAKQRNLRNQQFEYISQMREAFAKRGSPIISVDAKKKEQIGRFKNAGTSWEEEPQLVNDHDFRSKAEGIAISYGIYDTLDNFGFVVVGTSHETPAFAVDSIELWWKSCGCKMHADAKELLILADSGGSNSYRTRAWKYHLQYHFCNCYGLTVTVCHYPPGASKWNPIEHRLFSEITKNWLGIPLESYEKVLKYIRTTKTATGLKVRARLVKKQYKKGEKISIQDMATLSINRHKILPKLNYNLTPQKM